MEILNLDKFSPEDKKFILKSIEYSIPGDLPIETWFQLMNNIQNLEKGDIESVNKSFEILSNIIKIRNPEITPEKLSQILSLKQYYALVMHIFKNEADTLKENKEEEEKKTELEGDLKNAP